MGRVVIPGFRKIETSGGGEGGTTNYNDLTNKPSINNVTLVGNLNTVDLKLTDATLTEEGVPAEAKTVGTKLEEQSTSLTALSEQLGSHTVKSDVPENAVFTDTVYDDTEVQKRISDNGYGEVAGGKNLLNPDKTIIGELSEGIVLSGEHYISDYISIKSDTSYSISNCTQESNEIDWYTSDKTYISRSFGTPVVSPSNASYVRIEYMNNINAQVEEGSVATEYEPYFPSNKMLAEENTQQSTEMMDIKMLGWSVPKECPIQNEVNGNQFVQKVGRVDLGNYDYLRYEQKGFATKIIGIKNVPDGKTLPNIYCKGYRTVISDDTWVDGDISMLSYADEQVYIMDTANTDVVAFKSAMKGKYLYYELANYNTMTIDGNEIGETVSDVRKETTVNLLKPTLQTTNVNGITCTNNGDGTYTVDGKATSTTSLIFQENVSWDALKRLTGCPKGGDPYKYYLDLLKVSSGAQYMDTGEGTTITQSNSGSLRFVILKNQTITNAIVKPMLTTNLDATYDDFVPYTGDSGSLNGDVSQIKNDLDKLNSLPIGTIIQIDENKDNIETTKQKYGWQYLGKSNIEYDNGSATLLVTNVYRKND